MADINCLPNEILVRIFQYYAVSESQLNLEKYLSKVCRKWKEVWKTSCNFTTVDGSLPVGTLIRLAKEGSLKNTKSLKFGIQKSKENLQKKRNKANKSKKTKQSIFNESFTNFYANLPCLKSLNLGNICSEFKQQKKHYVFSELKDFCPDLCELIFGDPEKNSDIIISHSIFEEFLCARGSKLVTLDFSHVNISNMKKVFVIIANNCPNLEDLIVQYMTITPLSFPIQTMQIGCPKLKTLRLSSPIIFLEKFNPESPGFPQLEIFTYPDRGNIHFKDEYCLMLLNKSPELKILDIRGCQNVSVDAVASLPTTDLEQLYLSHTKITQREDMVRLLLKWCHSLRILDLSFTTGYFFNNVLGPSLMPQGIPELESLDVNYSSLEFKTLKFVIQQSPRLRFLNIQGCRSVERKIRRIYQTRNEIEELLKAEEIDLS